MAESDAARTTVVVVTRNRADVVLPTLRKLLELKPRPPIIVLDQRSEDDTVARLHELREEVVQLRVIRMANVVPAVARNLGADLARTEFVAFCDEGVYWACDGLSRAESLFDTDAQLGVITAKVLDASTGTPDDISASMAALQHSSQTRWPGPQVLCFDTAATVVRTDAYERVDGFDPLLHVAREERLLAYDFAAHGWQLCYVDSVCAYRAAPTAHAGHAQERRLALRDELVVSWLRRPARECVRATVALLRRCTHDRAAFLATLGAFRRLAWTIVERERLPADVEHRIRLEERAAEGRS